MTVDPASLETMKRRARKVLFDKKVADRKGVGHPDFSRSLPMAGNVLTLAAEVERLRGQRDQLRRDLNESERLRHTLDRNFRGLSIKASSLEGRIEAVRAALQESPA